MEGKISRKFFIYFHSARAQSLEVDACFSACLKKAMSIIEIV
jgi:hypothetical protein